MRHPRHPARRSRLRLHQPPPRADRSRPAHPDHPLDRRSTPRARKDREVLRHHQHRTPGHATRPPRTRQPDTNACPRPRRARSCDRRIHRHLQRPDPQRVRDLAAERMGRRRVAAPYARQPSRTRRAARLVVALAVVVLIDGAIIGIALSAGGAAALLIAIALSIELLFVAASTAGSARAGGGSLGTAIGVGAFVAVMMPIGAVLGAVVFAGVSAPVLIAGLGFGAAALLFTAVAELLVEAYEIKESTGTIAMAAGGFLLFLILMMLM
ncbi:ZIP family metal transporter [Microbacterium sp. No. 7]|uniref:ZIP family metal transporter n=1 Tax=Microbacterium sp. No. 7 TaxID=1714373 RepID=UPI002FFB42A4